MVPYGRPGYHSYMCTPTLRRYYLEAPATAWQSLPRYKQLNPLEVAEAIGLKDHRDTAAAWQLSLQIRQSLLTAG